jgi:hypothetical protein
LDFGFWIGQGVQGFFKIEKTVILFHVSFGNAIAFPFELRWFFDLYTRQSLQESFPGGAWERD